MKPALIDDSLEAVFARSKRWSQPTQSGRFRFRHPVSCANRAARDRYLLCKEVSRLQAELAAARDSFDSLLEKIKPRRGPTEAFDGGRLG